MKRSLCLPIEMVFHLLCIYRLGNVSSAKAIRNALGKRGLRSLDTQEGIPQRANHRLPFWRSLCQAASLLDDGQFPYPTLLAEDWVSWPFLEQMACLADAWVRVPESEKHQHARVNLLHRMKHSLALTAVQKADLPGLQALAICEGDRLSPLGKVLFANACKRDWEYMPSEGWRIMGNQLLVPFPPNWKWVWELEKFIQPCAPGSYPLDTASLRLANQRGARDHKPSLRQILEQGVAEPLPDGLLQVLVDAPEIRIVQGVVLEFSHPEELRRLRQHSGMRHKMDGMLSPRHVVLNPWRGHQVLRQLHRRGYLSEADLAGVPMDRPLTACSPGFFSKSDRAFLLSLILLAEGLQNGFTPPPGLIARLTDGLDHALRASAARRATQALNQIQPLPPWEPEESPPPIPDETLVTMLQAAIDRGEAVDVLYQASGRHTPEYRHLSPLILETRGERFYLLAYCHSRRANRTFRLDRLQLCGV